MSFLSYCKECGGWQWGPGPAYMDALVKMKIEQLQEMTPEERKALAKTPYEWPPLREGECGCGRTGALDTKTEEGQRCKE